MYYLVDKAKEKVGKLFEKKPGGLHAKVGVIV
jgi:hypothetical protein